ncbi:MAG: hypothetical protein ABSG41_25205 [Bryobacteraceae bacterium]|jgi:hypothetical protein
MQTSSLSFIAILLTVPAWQATAQVLAPAEIADPEIRGLQQSHLEELHAITAALAGHQFPYRFSFSRKLDLSERDQDRNDQRSIQFDRFQGKVVLKITGNYFAAYSAERMTKEERAARTWRDVMLPILQAAAPALAKAEVPDAFALEISHHVVRKVLGVDTESVENVVLILPKASARSLMAARDEAGQIAAVQEGVAYLNGTPISFWPGARKEPPAIQVSSLPSTPPASALAAVHGTPAAAAPSAPLVTPAAPTQPAVAPATLDAKYRDTLAKMLKDLDSQAHFVAYAPPSFMDFRGGQYLEIAIATPLAASDSGSQYKLAALAFDRHVAHLVRPVAAYFKDSADFTGIDFSTTARLAGTSAEGEGSEAVEFIFPLSALRSYAQFDLTGQQLLDAGVVLINGERVSLDLQIAEAGAQAAK